MQKKQLPLPSVLKNNKKSVLMNINDRSNQLDE